jgi:hypothetical protein
MSQQLFNPGEQKNLTRGVSVESTKPEFTAQQVLEKILPFRKREDVIHGFDGVVVTNLEMTAAIAPNQIGLAITSKKEAVIMGYFLPKPEDKVERTPKDLEMISEYLKDWDRLYDLITKRGLNNENIDNIFVFLGSEVSPADLKYTINSLERVNRLNHRKFEEIKIETDGSSLVYDPLNNQFLLTPLNIHREEISLADKEHIQEVPILTNKN